MAKLQQFESLGQSIWLDNISRGVIKRGELQQLVDAGLLGVTSNPTIFEKAISYSDDYDEQIKELIETDQSIDTARLIQALMVKDIQMACDVLSSVYDRTNGCDGYVSVEVTPSKARDTNATIEEVRELWDMIDRKNLMIKIPATKEGLPAIEQMISEGKNINVTLIFSVERYRQVAYAYINGLEKRLKSGNPLDPVASVASVFVSRIDTLVDKILDGKISQAFEDVEKEQYRSMFGKAAVANSKIVYQSFKEIFSSQRFKKLKEKGARVQRPLWGSTSTKNPAYDDLKYVDSLIGKDTVNTVPPQTLKAIFEKSNPALRIEEEVKDAEHTLEELQLMGIDLRWVMNKLEEDGVGAFAKSFDGLYKLLEDKKSTLVRNLAE